MAGNPVTPARDIVRTCRVGVLVAPDASAVLRRAAVFAAAELTVAGIDAVTVAADANSDGFDGGIWAGVAGDVTRPPNTVVIHERGVEATHLDVSYSLFDVGRVAAEHLRQYRRNRLAIVFDEDLDTARRAAILAGFGSVSTPALIADLADWPDSISAGRRRFDGVFATSALTAAVVVNTAQRRRLGVPGDLAVVGFDYSGTERIHLGVSLTTVDLPSRRMGSTAARMVIAALAGRRVGTTSRTLSPQITARRSAPRAPRPRTSERPTALIS